MTNYCQTFLFAGIRIRNIPDSVKSNYAYYPIVIDEKEFGASRNEVYAMLAKNNIFARKYFYPLTNSFECYHGRYSGTSTPIALHISNRILCLPLYADLSFCDVERCCSLIMDMAD